MRVSTTRRGAPSGTGTRPHSDGVARAAASLVIVSALVSLTATGLLPWLGAVPAALVAVGGVWWGSTAAGGVAGRAGAVHGLRLVVLVASGLVLAVLLSGDSRPGGRAGLLVTLTVLTMVASALELPTSRSLLMRCWLGCGAALLATGLADGPVTRGGVLCCVGGALVVLARWGQTGPAGPGPRARPAGPSAERTDPHPLSARLRWSLGPALLVVAASVVVFLLVGFLGGGGAGSLWSTPPADGLLGQGPGGGDGSGGYGEQDRGPAGERTVSGYVDGAMDLDARGDLDDTPLYRVPAGDGTLWRAAVLDLYDGRLWASSSPAPAVRVTADHGIGVQDVELARSGEGPRRRSTVQVVDPERALRFPVLAPGPVLEVHPMTRDGQFVPAERVAFAGDAGARVLLGPVGDEPIPAMYTVDWLDPDGTRNELSADAFARATLLPPLDPRVAALSARLVPDGTAPMDAVAAIETELRARARYDLDSPVTRKGQDAVADFLFHSRRGFCEHFAAAEVVLLRAAGIPARIATGFAAGAGASSQEWVTLTGADAHAWVEVWVAGRGWVSTDPTAGTLRAPTPGERISEALDAVRRSPWLLALVVVLALTVLLAVGWVVRRHRARLVRWWRAAVRWFLHRILRRPLPPAPEPGVPQLSADLAQAYRDLRAALAVAGVLPGPADGTRAIALRAAVVAGLPSVQLDALLAAVDVVERAAFSPRIPPPGECARAVTVLRSATAAVREVAGAGRVPSR